MAATFNLQRNEIIDAALLKIGALDPEGGSVSATQYTNHAKTLNTMLKAWQGFGIPMWAKKTGVLFLQIDQIEYDLGATSTDHFTNTYASTALAAAGASSASTITVDSASGISNGNYIGIELDTGSLHWTTVNGAPAGTVVTLTTALPSAAAIDNVVYSYTTKANRPLKIYDQSYIRYMSGGNDRIVSMITSEEYARFGLKTTPGSPVNAYYDPQLTLGVLWIYPEPNDVSQVLYLTYQRPFEDFSISTDTPDVPQEWLEAMVYGLAARLAPEYGLEKNERKFLMQEAAMALSLALSFDQEEGSIFFQPSNKVMYGSNEY